MKKLFPALVCAIALTFFGCEPNNNNVNLPDSNAEENSSSSTSAATLTGVFSVGPSQQVQFASGNLQCKPNSKKWRFAQQQYNVIGSANNNASMSYDGWIDLFAWSTASSYYGVYYSNKESDYAGDFVDWGKAIGEGWFTLSADEWNYLLEGRPNAANLFGIACINGKMNGLVFLPDKWSLPDGLSFVSGKMASDQVPVPNAYSASDWAKMEKTGAVFLPAAGSMEFDDNEDVEEVNYMGAYWTATPEETLAAYYLVCEGGKDVGVDYETRASGMSVRLVKSAQQNNNGGGNNEGGSGGKISDPNKINLDNYNPNAPEECWLMTVYSGSTSASSYLWSNEYNLASSIKQGLQNAGGAMSISWEKVSTGNQDACDALNN